MALPWQKRPLPSRGSIPIRPLDKGMDLNVMPQLITPGGFRNIQNYFANPTGLKRMPGWTNYTVNPANSEFLGTAQSLIHAFETDLTPISLLITTCAMYVLQGSATAIHQVFYDDPYPGFNLTWNATAKTIIFAAGTVINDPSMLNNVGVAVGAQAPFFDATLCIKQGDILMLSDGAHAVKVWVHSIENGTIIHYTPYTDYPGNPTTAPDGTVLADFVSSSGTTTTGFIVRRSLHQFVSTPVITQLVDGWFYGGQLYITAQGIPLGVFNGTAVGSSVVITPTSYAQLFDPQSAPSSGTIKWLAYTAAVGSFFKSWMWLGGIQTGNSIDNRRITWSNPFAPATDWSDPTSYIDLPYSPGKIVKLLPENEQLIAYTDDGIFYGYNTNLPGLPLAFQRFDTGGLGAVGGRAITSIQNGHFFVSQNNIHFLDANGVTVIGNQVVKRSINQCSEEFYNNIIVVHDIEQHAVLFGFPKSNAYIEEIYCFDYRTKAWSMFKKLANFISGNREYIGISWSGIPVTAWSALTEQHWYDFSNAYGAIDIITDANSNFLFKRLADNIMPSNTDDTYSEIETGDIDLNAPDIVKSWLRYSLTIEDYINYDSMSADGPLARTSPIIFTIYHSTDSGQNWRQDGQLIIPPNKTEGYVNFRAIGEKIRFKITTDSLVPSFAITQYVMDVSQANPNQSLKTQGA